MLGFQGLIKDNMGNPITGMVDLEFRIFDAETLGSQVDMNGDGVVDVLDTVQVFGVTASDGIVSTKFGPVNPSAFDGNERWLEVSVDGSPLSRVEMVTAPATAEQVNVPLTGTSAIFVDDAGNVGIGTTEPSARLDIAGGGAVAATGVITSVGTTVTGIGTAFTTQHRVADVIIVGLQEKLVNEIASDTELITDSPFDPPANKSVYTFRQAIVRFADSSGTEALSINA